ncbi:hypothetical protein [Asticcacaulis sp.]|uniref:hypothetical protein n=1 Tax=Asticcacaulis sp. TaxID=1872648 RepID=UPI002CAEB1FA|nr:hypothetical protein [Asticcacaulis sp.]HTM83098.1 hypothetical protein [Asticcacaulis sp.]
MQIGSSFSPITASYGSTKKTQSPPTDPLMQIAPSASDTSETTLMKFLKMTPAEKMQYTWLNAHHLTKEKLAAMSPDERAAVQKQMESEIQQKAREGTEKKTGKSVDILV